MSISLDQHSSPSLGLSSVLLNSEQEGPETDYGFVPLFADQDEAKPKVSGSGLKDKVIYENYDAKTQRTIEMINEIAPNAIQERLKREAKRQRVSDVWLRAQKNLVDLAPKNTLTHGLGEVVKREVEQIKSLAKGSVSSSSTSFFRKLLRNF